MSDNTPEINWRWYGPLMMIIMSGYLFSKGPASNTAQFLFRLGTLFVGLTLLLVLNLPKSGTGSDGRQ